MALDPLTRLLLRGQPTGLGPVALMYHSVVPGAGTPSWPWSVSMRQFRNQLDYLAGEGYSTATVQDLHAGAAGATSRQVVITFDDGYVDNLAAWEELQRRDMRATWFIVTGSVGQVPAWADPGRPAGRLLSASELRAMDASGVEIGSHAVTHARLTETDADSLHHELTDSKAALEEALGHAVTAFAYPYGAWNERCEAAVRSAGYRTACLTQTGRALRDQNPYRLRRLTVFNRDSTSVFARKLTFATHDVQWPQMAGYLARRLRTKWKGQP